MVDLSQSALVDEFASKRHRRRLPVIVEHCVRNPRLFHRLNHKPGFFQCVSNRFLTKDRLSGLRSRNRDLGVQVPGSRDIDDVDLRVGHNSTPISFNVLPSESFSCLSYSRQIASAKGVHHHFHRQVEEVSHLPIGVAVGFAHKLITDQADVNLLLCHCSSAGLHSPRGGSLCARASLCQPEAVAVRFYP